LRSGLFLGFMAFLRNQEGTSVLRAIVSDRASLAKLRTLYDLDEVVLQTSRLKYSGLVPCAVKYALWALRQGGRLIVEDTGRADATFVPFTVPFNLIRQWIFKFAGNDVELESFDAAGRMVLRRIAPVTPPGWSAGIVFSGSDAEIPTLRASLQGLLAQPELLPQAGGEIAVCGPARDLAFLDEFPSVRYIVYDEPSDGRFLVCRKKNALIAALRNPRVAILHARIVLEADALRNVPREFDITGPNTVFVAGGRRLTYLSLTQTQSVWPGTMPRHFPFSLRQMTSQDPLRLHERGGLFVDGGAFYVRRAVWEACPLNDNIAWLEDEDVEWCARAFLNGFLIDLAPRSGAISQTSKLSVPPDFGRFTPLIIAAVRNLRWLLAAGRYYRKILFSHSAKL
jgi:transposase InsO family protein